VHNCGIRRDGASQDIIGIGEVDDDDKILLVDFLSYTNKVVGF
jgi:hypothetical protein